MIDWMSSKEAYAHIKAVQEEAERTGGQVWMPFTATPDAYALAKVVHKGEPEWYSDGDD
jgi:hypothetical protein